MAKKANAKQGSTDQGSPQIRGKAVLRSVSDVEANPWNPNRMTPEMLAGLRRDLRTEGYIAAQALLVWGKDDVGKARNMIIDGEHRWVAAKAEGFPKLPMVFLDGLAEHNAKALTIKLNKKRGEFVDELLAPVVKELQQALDVDDLASDLGFDTTEFEKLIATDQNAIPGSNGSSSGRSTGKGASASGKADGSPVDPAKVRLVQLYFNDKNAAQFDADIATLTKKYGKDSVSDLVFEAVHCEAERPE